MQANKEQERAIATINGPVILVSCPGSGKTTTLLRRILNIVKNNVQPSQILMITFTKAAADEMKKKYKAFGGPEGVTFSTIHALYLKVLLTFGGYTKDDILKETDARFFLINLARKDYKINDPVKAVTLFMTQYSAARNNRVDIQKLIPEGISKDSFLYLAKRYVQFKKEEHKIDFDDMLQEAYDLLCGKPDVLALLQNTWKYIQVDEYQDVNGLQRDLIYMLVEKSRNLCVAGDDDQSIYGFRGADPNIMLDFMHDFPDAQKINISTNYRSYPDIILQASNLIANNKNRFAKEFLAGRTGTAEIFYESEKNIKEEIEQLIRDIKRNSYAPKDIAVLYRNNSQAEAVANLFYKNGLPFISTEKIPDSYESWIWEDIMAYYRLSRKAGSERDLARIIDRPNRYLTKIFKSAKTKDHKGLLAETHILPLEWQRESAVKAINRLFMDLDIMSKKDPLDFFMYLMYKVGYFSYLKSYANAINQDMDAIESSLDLFKSDASKFKKMEDWLVNIKKRSFSLKQVKAEGITLSTMHRAKGLEWKCVYIIDCNDNVIPSSKNKSPDAVEEERRLFYVAVTRAKETLHLMYVKNALSSKEGSRFLKEMRKNGMTEKNSDEGFHKNDLVTHDAFGMCIVLDARGNSCRIQSLSTGKEYTILKEYLKK